MNFDELNETIPYATGGKEKILKYSPYPNVTIAMPGRHQNDTEIIGADFVVMVTDPIFKTEEHQFTHDDIFTDIYNKTIMQANPAHAVLEDYLLIVQGAEIPEMPKAYQMTLLHPFDYGINVLTFLQAVQCLAVAEHRRYARFEKKYGGRYLPFRFAAGISEGLWTAQDAIDKQRQGRPGVEWLEKEKGVPQLTKELMS